MEIILLRLGILLILIYMEDSYGKQSKNRMEEDTMATATKPLNHAFVLKSDKAEAFLNQDNSNFKKVMEKFEKFTNKKCHSKSEK